MILYDQQYLKHLQLSLFIQETKLGPKLFPVARPYLCLEFRYKHSLPLPVVLYLKDSFPKFLSRNPYAILL